MAEDWGIKISKPNVDVKQPLTKYNKKDFVVVSTDSCLRIKEAKWQLLYDTYDIYVVTVLTNISVPMTFTFQPDDKDDPTEWTVS